MLFCAGLFIDVALREASTPAITQATQLAHNGLEGVAPTVIGQPRPLESTATWQRRQKSEQPNGNTFFGSHHVLRVSGLAPRLPNHHLAKPLVLSSRLQLSSSRRPRTTNQLH